MSAGDFGFLERPIAGPDWFLRCKSVPNLAKNALPFDSEQLPRQATVQSRGDALTLALSHGDISIVIKSARHCCRRGYPALRLLPAPAPVILAAAGIQSPDNVVMTTVRATMEFLRPGSSRAGPPLLP